MRPTTQAELEQFHDTVMHMSRELTIPYDLKINCNDEFRRYLDGQEGNWYYRWLRAAVQAFDANIILELGTNRGASSIAMWTGKPQSAFLMTVDIQDCGTFFPTAMKNDYTFMFRLANDLDPKTVFLSPDFARLNPNIDFLFIDTDHRAEHLRKELAIYLPMLAPGALVVLDDININDMREVWDELPYVKLDISQDCHYSGFGVFVYQPQDIPKAVFAPYDIDPSVFKGDVQK